MLLRALPPEAPLWAALEREREEANRPKPDQIRERQEHYRRLAAQQKEEAGG